jgi:hypothetical protein
MYLLLINHWGASTRPTPFSRFYQAPRYAALIFELSLIIIEPITFAVIVVTPVAALRSHDVLRGSKVKRLI